jgi:hypothetical protein
VLPIDHRGIVPDTVPRSTKDCEELASRLYDDPPQLAVPVCDHTLVLAIATQRRSPAPL